ncbi:Wall-associated receptor kinase-like 10 [Citrus sinensis]|nr:Wall-associated receptor kinase-like 10 [Citrus sinensis]
MAVHNGLVLLHIIMLLCTVEAAAEALACPDRCGDVGIQYPFGIGAGCYFDESFEVVCTPFSFSQGINKFLAIGCDNYANNQQNDSISSNSILTDAGGECISICTCNPSESSGCCDMVCNIPQNSSTKVLDANTSNVYSRSIPEGCTSLSLVYADWIFSHYLETPSGDLICNTTSGHNCSKCPDGYNYDPVGSYGSVQEPGCSRMRTKDSFLRKKTRVKYVVIGCTSGGLGMFLLIGAWWLFKFVKRRREIKLKRKYFKRNGGLLLQQELASTEGTIEKTKLFTSKELEKATDNFDLNRILGQGGQEVPLLVYEFIPNGTLFQYIHDQNEDFPITWEIRLRIAIEVSGALSYLHSAASIPIYHRDIKSTNILLDDKYRAKVSDFGASRSMAVDQTHMTTQVHGTFGYLDPEYFRSSQFTDKSDVYSFGVVLTELLTGEKPIRFTILEEDKSLAAYFLCAMKEERLFEILDARVMKQGGKDEIITVAKLAKRCLNLNGKKRPTMREVASELAGIKAWNGASNVIEEGLEEIDCALGDIYIVANSETNGSINESFLDDVTVSVDANPLIKSNW